MPGQKGGRDRLSALDAHLRRRHRRPRSTIARQEPQGSRGGAAAAIVRADASSADQGLDRIAAVHEHAGRRGERRREGGGDGPVATRRPRGQAAVRMRWGHGGLPYRAAEIAPLTILSARVRTAELALARPNPQPDRRRNSAERTDPVEQRAAREPKAPALPGTEGRATRRPAPPAAGRPPPFPSRSSLPRSPFENRAHRTPSRFRARARFDAAALGQPPSAGELNTADASAAKPSNTAERAVSPRPNTPRAT